MHSRTGPAGHTGTAQRRENAVHRQRHRQADAAQQVQLHGLAHLGHKRHNGAELVRVAGHDRAAWVSGGCWEHAVHRARRSLVSRMHGAHLWHSIGSPVLVQMCCGDANCDVRSAVAGPTPDAAEARGLSREPLVARDGHVACGAARPARPHGWVRLPRAVRIVVLQIQLSNAHPMLRGAPYVVLRCIVLAHLRGIECATRQAAVGPPSTRSACRRTSREGTCRQEWR